MLKAFIEFSRNSEGLQAVFPLRLGCMAERLFGLKSPTELDVWLVVTQLNWLKDSLRQLLLAKFGCRIGFASEPMAGASKKSLLCRAAVERGRIVSGSWPVDG